MATGLSAYLEQWGPARLRWGVCDCYLFALRWARELEPGTIVGAYDGRKGALEVLRFHGGLVPAVEASLAGGAWRRAPDELADVAVIDTPRGMAGVIGAGPYWLGKTSGGLSRMRRELAPALGAWTVDACRK